MQNQLNKNTNGKTFSKTLQRRTKKDFHSFEINFSNRKNMNQTMISMFTHSMISILKNSSLFNTIEIGGNSRPCFRFRRSFDC